MNTSLFKSNGAGQGNINFVNQDGKLVDNGRLGKQAFGLRQLTVRSESFQISPLVAEQLAKIVARYWEQRAAAGDMNPDAFVDVIDLAPGNGVPVWRMLRALQVRLPREGLRLRYLPVGMQRSAFALLRSQPEFALAIANGTLVPMLWESLLRTPCLLTSSGRQPWRVANPAVILAHDFWSFLPQRLLAVHYGKLLEADSAVLRRAANEQSQNPQQENLWKDFDDPHWENTYSDLAKRYLAKFNSAPIPYPQEAIHTMEKLVELSTHGCLLLAASRGCASEHSLRLGRFTDLIEAMQEQRPLPVNFHLIGHRLRQRGGRVLEAELQRGIVLQSAVFSSKADDDDVASLLYELDASMFHHAAALGEAMNSLGISAALDSRLALLKLSCFDPDVFSCGHANLLAAFSKHPDFDKPTWRRTLELVWENHLPQEAGNPLHRLVAPAAMHCGHWGLARRVLLRGMQSHGRNAVDLANLAWCEVRSGYIEKGKELVAEALRRDPHNALAAEVSQRIAERLQSWDGIWRISLRHEAVPISLEPLDQSHAEAFLYQYRDPQIAIMTGLPAMATLAEVRDWITHQEGDRNRVNFAVMHADHGFVGYINLAVSGHAAYFCFWTGVDFQGNGWATKAGCLACEYATKRGIGVMLTSAYKDNARSISALKRIGFTALAVNALPPDNDRIFFSKLDTRWKATDSVAELVAYYERENLPLHFPSSSGISPDRME